MHVITETDELARFCAGLADQPFLVVDTEFLRETTYWPKLCLIQAAAPGREAIIDPLAPGLDLAAFLALMTDTGLTKVFHAARQDLEIFLGLCGRLPAPIFDSQIGAMACGLGDSIAYDALVQAMLKRRVDKTHRFTDWSRRPLSKDQLIYALADVTHLRDLYPKMIDRLEKAGRHTWLEDEHATLIDPDNYDTNPANAWQRLKLRKTTPEYLAVLVTAAAWRERAAQAKDVPRARIMKDDALYEVAEHRPRSVQAFDRLRAVPKGFGQSKLGQELIADIEHALADPAAIAPQVERQGSTPQGVAATVELLKVLLRVEAERHEVAARLIANAADLEAIAIDDSAPVRALSGWRRAIFGDRALALKHGKIALTLDRGKVSIVES
jgi:ribonuclease D